jgi:hypothetical protein
MAATTMPATIAASRLFFESELPDDLSQALAVLR